MEHIEDNKGRKFAIGEENIEYQISAKIYYAIELIFKIMYLFVGAVISYYILYNICLVNFTCNSIVTFFFSILALSCFQAAGFPIEKLMNIRLT
jgi:uncharacterized Tic20 family protein